MLKLNKDLDTINEMYEAGKIKPVMDRPYRLEEVPDAFQCFVKGSHKGKLVIHLN